MVICFGDLEKVTVMISQNWWRVLTNKLENTYGGYLIYEKVTDQEWVDPNYGFFRTSWLQFPFIV